GLGHLARLAVTEADAALLVADDDERGEAEAPTALHHLGHAIDMHELVDKLAVALLAVSALRASAPFAIHYFDPLEIQACFARGLGKRLDAPMVEIAATIEPHFLDARLKRALGHELAHGSRRRKVAALRQIAFEVLVQGRRRGNRLAGAVVDHLRIDVLRGAEHRQTRAPVGRSPKRGTDPARTPHEAFIQRAHGLVLLLLAFLAEDELARVFHAL